MAKLRREYRFRENRQVLDRSAFFYILLPIVMIFLLALSPTYLSAGTAKENDNSRITKDVKPPNFTGGYEKGEIVVKYRDSINITEIKAINSRLNVRIKRKLPMERSIYLLSLPKGMSVKEAAAELSKVKDVEYARPNYTYHKKRGMRAR